MPVLDSYERLPLSAIRILRAKRQRRQIDTADLEPSIAARGVIFPIVVRLAEDGQAELVAGERRLEASRNLGLADIPIRWAHDLSMTECQIIELEENIKRQDLLWQDRVGAVERLHRLYLALDPAWTMTETARAVSLELSTVSMYRRVFEEIGSERVAGAKTVREAYNVVARRDAREGAEALEELLAAPAPTVADLPAPEPGLGPEATVLPPALLAKPVIIAPVLCASFLDWAPAYAGPRFNLIHCDFPYGTGVMDGPQAAGSTPTEQLYSDGLDTYLALLECLCSNLPRIASQSCHLVFWASSEILLSDSAYAQKTWAAFRRLAPRLEFWPYPLLWIKSDNAGVARDPRRGPRHVYEVALLASLGSRQIVRIVSDAYSAPTDKRFHPSTKPEPMLRHFLSMLVDETSSVLDPTAGGGSALRAADSLGASRVLGLELDPEHAKVANQAFRNSRALRTASKEVA